MDWQRCSFGYPTKQTHDDHGLNQRMMNVDKQIGNGFCVVAQPEHRCQYGFLYHRIDSVDSI
eukprot:3836588-Lingulodinium_polyedra.AAC.1